jgi:hypothetical protein
MLPEQQFLWQLIDAGNTDIFQWVAVWVASGIGVIQLIIETFKTTEFYRRRVYGVIYGILVLLMTFSVYNILNVMRLQNGWANQLPESEKNLFYESRSLANLIAGNTSGLTVFGYALILINFAALAILGIKVWRVRHVEDYE